MKNSEILWDHVIPKEEYKFIENKCTEYENNKYQSNCHWSSENQTDSDLNNESTIFLFLNEEEFKFESIDNFFNLL